MNEEKGIQGFKKSEFATATPERVFGSADVRIEDLPQGVRLYLREKSVDLGSKKVLVNVYRLLDDGGLKNKRIWVGRMKANRKPEDEEIAEQFGGGSYIWILKWTAPDGQECGIVSETIEIDEEFGRAAHEGWKRRQVGADSTPVGLPAAVPAAPPAVAGGLDMVGMLKLLEAAEEKSLARFERMAAIFQGGRSDTPAEVLQSAYKGASEMMQKAVETNLSMAKAVNRQNQLALTSGDPEPAEPAGGAEPAGPQMPAWLEPFMPHIEKGIGKLLEGGPMGNAVKTLILSSEEWQEIFQDKDKFGQAVAAMESNFGSDRTRRALDILLNRRDTKKGKGK
jgi:hypothetical protein